MSPEAANAGVWLYTQPGSEADRRVVLVVDKGDRIVRILTLSKGKQVYGRLPISGKKGAATFTWLKGRVVAHEGDGWKAERLNISTLFQTLLAVPDSAAAANFLTSAIVELMEDDPSFLTEGGLFTDLNSGQELQFWLLIQTEHKHRRTTAVLIENGKVLEHIPLVVRREVAPIDFSGRLGHANLENLKKAVMVHSGWVLRPLTTVGCFHAAAISCKVQRGSANFQGYRLIRRVWELLKENKLPLPKM